MSMEAMRVNAVDPLGGSDPALEFGVARRELIDFKGRKAACVKCERPTFTGERRGQDGDAGVVTDDEGVCPRTAPKDIQKSTRGGNNLLQFEQRTLGETASENLRGLPGAFEW